MLLVEFVRSRLSPVVFILGGVFGPVAIEASGVHLAFALTSSSTSLSSLPDPIMTCQRSLSHCNRREVSSSSSLRRRRRIRRRSMRTMRWSVMDIRWVDGGVSGRRVAADNPDQLCSEVRVNRLPLVFSFIRARSPPSNARISSSVLSLSRCHSVTSAIVGSRKPPSCPWRQYARGFDPPSPSDPGVGNEIG